MPTLVDLSIGRIGVWCACVYVVVYLVFICALFGVEGVEELNTFCLSLLAHPLSHPFATNFVYELCVMCFSMCFSALWQHSADCLHHLYELRTSPDRRQGLLPVQVHQES